MPTIKKILCPVDFSDASRTAALYSLELARQLGASVELLYTCQLASMASPASALAAEVVREARADLDAFAGKLPHEGVSLTRALRVGAPYVEIVSAAVDGSFDMIVMGTTGRTGLEHFLLGSVAERVVQSSPVPVLTVNHKKTAG